MVMKISDLTALYLITKNVYSVQNEALNVSAEQLKTDVQTHARNHFNITHGARLPQTLRKNIDKVVDMYLELMTEPVLADVETEALPRSARYHHSYLDQLVHRPLFSYTDRSWNTYNTTNHNNTQSSEKKKNQTLEEILLQVGITVGAVIIGAIAVVSFGYLAAEMANHISRIYHNEGTVEGFMLLSGMGLSYCLAALTLYEVAGGLLMAGMTAAAFVNPAAWAATFIVLGAVVATPIFNMVIREGIYSLFSMFDSQALVKEDNRFRGLSDAEIDSLPRAIDPDRVNFATLCKYSELKPTQTRQQFSFFDYNSIKMTDVIHDVREMRRPGVNSILIKSQEDDQNRLFSLKRPGLTPAQASFAKDAVYAEAIPSAPPGCGY